MQIAKYTTKISEKVDYGVYKPVKSIVKTALLKEVWVVDFKL